MTMASRAPKRFTLWQIFVVPLAIAVITGVGLVLALLGDGIWDLMSWLALAIPIAVTVWYARPGR